MANKIITLEDLWRIDDEIKGRWGKYVNEYINYCGLEPIRPLENGGYSSTPQNSLAFARTGGDGVHYSIVNAGSENELNGPIVMTVPMASKNNLIIAEDLTEFFSIGYYIGWFGLEVLVYDLEQYIDDFSRPDPEMSEEEMRFIEMVRNQLKIKYQPITKRRLGELEDKYFNQLVINDLD